MLTEILILINTLIWLALWVDARRNYFTLPLSAHLILAFNTLFLLTYI